jgi:hypothetical protein
MERSLYVVCGVGLAVIFTTTVLLNSPDRYLPHPPEASYSHVIPNAPTVAVATTGLLSINVHDNIVTGTQFTTQSS